MARWIMVVDLAKCIGCERCVAVCSYNNQLPIGVSWRRIVRAEIDAGGMPRSCHVPLSCMHCANPPCRDVCPTGATARSADGIVDIDYDKCVGCGYCTVACPYSARTIVPKASAEVAALTQARGDLSHPRDFTGGVCTKCDMCAPKIRAAFEAGLRPGIDPGATPSCANACLWQAIHFGDADDPDSRVSRLLREKQLFRIHEELGTDPSIYYMWSEAG